jgi:hypothetical protein
MIEIRRKRWIMMVTYIFVEDVDLDEELMEDAAQDA